MAKTSITHLRFTKRVEQWAVKNDGGNPAVKTPLVTVTKIAVRDRIGRFHGSTNFPMR